MESATTLRTIAFKTAVVSTNTTKKRDFCDRKVKMHKQMKMISLLMINRKEKIAMKVMT